MIVYYIDLNEHSLNRLMILYYIDSVQKDKNKLPKK